MYNSRCTSNSYNVVERLLKYREDEFVVHNGVNTDETAVFETEVEEVSTVVSATRLIPRKNLTALIESLRYVADIRLRVIGDGPERDRLERAAMAAGVEDRVEFTGYLPERRDIYRELSRGDVFALPSRGEGFWVSVAEAMAIGLPVVVSNLPVFHEVVGSGGVFVDHESPRVIGAALDALRTEPARARSLGEQNRARIAESFTLARCARGYRDVYRTVLEA